MSRLFAVALSILPLTGCVGIGALYPTERPVTQDPEFGPDVGEYYPRIDYYRNINPGSLKCAELIAQWGPPNNISTSGDNKILVYKHGLLFAGLVPMLGIPIPLALPVGRKSTAITCNGEKLVSAYGTGTEISGAACGIGTFIQGGNAKDAFACTAISR